MNPEVDPNPDPPVHQRLTARASTRLEAKKLLANKLHVLTFGCEIDLDDSENFNGYGNEIEFLESCAIHNGMCDSYTATMVWDSLYEAIGTLEVATIPEGTTS